MDATDLPDGAARRAQVGAFLRLRRERRSPAQVGLPEGFRRRTPGLRREEVAMLAGVGATWYTWLEQGRDVHPSDAVLAAVARVLGLDDAERRHLFLLHDRAPPERPAAQPEQVSGSLRRMLHSLTEQPAFVLGRRWDILAWNKAAETVFGRYDRLQGDERNALHLLFVDPLHRRMMLDWEAVARPTLAMFRADSARHAGDPTFERLIAKLCRSSEPFASWWTRHEVAQSLAGCKRIDHPRAGRMVFEFSSYSVDDAPETKLVVFTPADEDATRDKLLDLLRAGPAAARGLADAVTS